jgi:MarR family transcriptional regulator, transcriptional regulator for hemolysin
MGAETAPAPVKDSGAEHGFRNNLGWLLKSAHYALASEMIAAFEPLGVSARGYHVLVAALDANKTQKELAELVGLDKTTMVVTIDELEAAGLAERCPSTTDRRARVIAVTNEGRRKVTEGRKIVDHVQEDVLSALPAKDRKALLEGLDCLVRGRLSEAVECHPPLRRREPRG